MDGFTLTHDDVGSRSAGVLLHGWPGDRTDYRRVLPRVTPYARFVVPDLRGFGESDKHDAESGEHYSAQAQARSVAALIEELELGSAVVGGYDVGSGVAHALVRARLDLVRALVLAPPLPGTGGRELGPQGQRGFCTRAFTACPWPTD